MGITQHTPDPTQGAVVEANGYVTEPDDTERMKAANIRLPVEQIVDWIAFLVKGPANDINFKITGTGTPPAGGYTPATNPIRINGTGLQLNGAPLNFAGGATITGTASYSGATLSGTVTDSSTSTRSGATTRTGAMVRSGTGGYETLRGTTLTGTAETIVGTDFDVIYADLTAGDATYTLEDSPAPPEGAVVVVWASNQATGNFLEVRRETGGGQLIATYGIDTHGSGTYMYRSAWAGWRLIGGFGITAGGLA